MVLFSVALTSVGYLMFWGLLLLGFILVVCSMFFVLVIIEIFVFFLVGLFRSVVMM